MNDEQRGTAVALVAAGLESGRLLYVRRFLPNDMLYAVLKTEPGARAFEKSPTGGGTPGPPGRESADLTGSIDRPAEESIVTGNLTVTGWARILGQDLDVTVLIDKVPRNPLQEARVPRVDVEAVVKTLGSCRTAGYEQVFAFQPGDGGEHELAVVFRGSDDRVRHYPPRKFTWKKGPFMERPKI